MSLCLCRCCETASDSWHMAHGHLAAQLLRWPVDRTLACRPVQPSRPPQAKKAVKAITSPRSMPRDTGVHAKDLHFRCCRRER
jgi:hypothetical protein